MPKDLYRLWSNPKVVRYMYCPLKETTTECEEWIKGLLSRSDGKNDFVAKYNDLIE